MPLDASIYGDFKAPQVQPFSISSLMDAKGKMAEIQLRQAQTAQQNQLVEQERLKTQQLQSDQMDDSTIKEMMGDPTIGPKIATGDVTPLYGKVKQSKVDALQTSIQNHIKEQAATDTTTLTNRKGAYATLADGILGLGDDVDTINARLPQLKDTLASQGVFRIAGLDPAKVPSRINSLDDLKQWEAGVNVAQAVNEKALALRKETQPLDIAASKEARDVAESAVKLPVEKAVAAATLADPNLLKPEERQQATQSAATLEEAKIRDRQTQSNENARLGLERERVSMERQKLGGSYTTLNPQQQTIVKQLAAGDFSPTQLGRFPDKEALVAAAGELNPNWAQAYATKKAFTDPASQQSKNLGTIARIVEHLDRFEGNSDSLGFSPSMLTGTNLTGTAAKVHEDAHAIASELEKLVSGGVGTQGQVKAIQEGLTSSRHDIRQAASEELSQLVGGQFASMNQSYKAGLGKDLPLDQFASPHAQKWLQKNGINVTGGSNIPTPGTQAEFNALPRGAQFKKPNDSTVYVKQ